MDKAGKRGAETTNNNVVTKFQTYKFRSTTCQHCGQDIIIREAETEFLHALVLPNKQNGAAKLPVKQL